MSDTIENSTELSCSLPPQPVEVNISIDPSLATCGSSSTSSNVSAPSLDQYTDSGPLSLQTLVQLRNPRQFGGRTSLTVGTLLTEAAHSTAAQDEIIALVQHRAGDPQVTQMCYEARDEALSNILAQLISTDPTARQEGRLALQQYILDNGKDLELRLGVLATVAHIHETTRNDDARQLLVQVYRQTPHNSALGQGMTRLNNHAVILQAVGQQNVAARSQTNSALEPGNAGGGGARFLATGVAAAVGDDRALGFSVLPAFVLSSTALTAEQAGAISTVVERLVQGTILEGIPSEEIVATTQRHLGQAADQFKQGLRLGVLGLGMRFGDFPGSQFAGSALIATRVVDQIASIVFNGSASSSDSSRRPLNAAAGNDPERLSHGNDVIAGVGTSPSVVAQAPGQAGSIEGLRPGTLLGGSNPYLPASHPMTTTLAGMQGAAPQTLAYAGHYTFGAARFSDNPSYFVEGPTADEGAHDSNSQGGNSEGSGSHQQHQPAPDNFA